MKTAVTIINCIQTGMDNFKDVKTTKVFDDNVTLLEIKEWVNAASVSKKNISEISLGTVEISDVID